MSTTFLNGVNDLLTKAGVIDSQNLLITLTDSGNQVNIDRARRVLNEVLEELYSATNEPMPKIMSSNTITLVNGDRDYTLQADVVRLRFPLRDETHQVYIREYPGGYFALIDSQPSPDNFRGIPNYGAIRPSDGQLYLDMEPTAAEAGRIFQYEYEKEGFLDIAGDLFPCTDATYRGLMPAAYELYRKYTENKFDSGVFNASMGRAARFMTGKFPRRSWLPKRNLQFEAGPFNAN